MAALPQTPSTAFSSSSNRAKQFDHYQVGDFIGKGASGTVFKATDLDTNQTVAVKQIDLQLVDSADVDAILTEVRILRDLFHPNIVQILDIIRSDHYLNLILEFAERGSLAALLKQSGPVPETQASAYVCQILCGLAYLHEHDVVHCDIKCANILVNDRGEVKLTDFGVSKNLPKTLTTTGTLSADDAIGTPYWMAPEVIELEGATEAADIWSLGCTVVELLTGHPPYHHLGPLSAMYHIATDPSPPYPPTLSLSARAFLQRCWKRKPTERATSKQLLEEEFVTVRRSKPSSALLSSISAKENPMARALNAKKGSNLQEKSLTLLKSSLVSLGSTSELRKGSAHALARLRHGELSHSRGVGSSDLMGSEKYSLNQLSRAESFHYFFGSEPPVVQTIKIGTLTSDQIKDIFDVLKSEKDGLIDYERFKLMVRSLGYLVTEKQLAKALKDEKFPMDVSHVETALAKLVHLPKFNATDMKRHLQESGLDQMKLAHVKNVLSSCGEGIDLKNIDDRYIMNWGQLLKL